MFLLMPRSYLKRKGRGRREEREGMRRRRGGLLRFISKESRHQKVLYKPWLARPGVMAMART